MNPSISPPVARAFAVALLLIVGVTGCSKAASVPTKTSPPRVKPRAVGASETFDGGRLTLAPPTKAKAVTAEIRSRIEGNQDVAGFEKKGYKPTIGYGLYTDSAMGTPDDVSPDKAASGHPAPSERQDLSSQPANLTFDKTPAWIVHFDNLPASAVSMFRRGPHSSASGPESTDSVGSGTVLIVFSADAKHELDLRTF